MAATTKTKGGLYNGPTFTQVQLFKPTGAVSTSVTNSQKGRVERATAEWSRIRPYFPSATELIKTETRYRDIRIAEEYDSTNYHYWWSGVPNALCSRHPPLEGPCSLSIQTVTQADAGMMAEAAFQKAAARQAGEIINLGETLGSARETALMVAKRTSQFAKFLKHLNSRNTEGVISSLATRKPSKNFKQKVKQAMDGKSAANAFLELKFGWLQLMADIHSGMTARGKLYSNGQTVRGRSGILSPNMPDGKDASGSGMPQLGGKGGYYARVYNDRIANLNALGLANPLLTAWELTPLSFVADWFLPLSRLLAGMSAFVGMHMYGGWVVGVGGSIYSTSLYGWYYSSTVAIRRPVGIFIPDVMSLGVDLPTRDIAGKVLVSTALIRQRLGDTAKASRSW